VSQADFLRVHLRSLPVVLVRTKAWTANLTLTSMKSSSSSTKESFLVLSTKGFDFNPNAIWWPNGTTWGFEDFNYTTIECEAPMACDLYGGAASGAVVCSSRHSGEGFFVF
jgi:hypothetical protein